MNELEQLRAENAKLIRAAEIFMACHEEMSGAITKITGHFNADDGPRKLYPGQAALWADEWMRCQPECWAIDAPGTR